MTPPHTTREMMSTIQTPGTVTPTVPSSARRDKSEPDFSSSRLLGALARGSKAPARFTFKISTQSTRRSGQPPHPTTQTTGQDHHSLRQPLFDHGTQEVRPALQDPGEMHGGSQHPRHADFCHPAVDQSPHRTQGQRDG